MKKTVLMTALFVGLMANAFAQHDGGGMLGRGAKSDGGDLTTPLVVQEYGSDKDQDANEAPVGSGIALLLGLGGAYLVAKRRKEK